MSKTIISSQAFDIFSLAALLLIYYNVIPIFFAAWQKDTIAVSAFVATILTYMLLGSEIEKVIRRFT